MAGLLVAVAALNTAGLVVIQPQARLAAGLLATATLVLIATLFVVARGSVRQASERVLESEDLKRRHLAMSQELGRVRSEAKKAETALRESEQSFKNLMQSSPMRRAQLEREALIEKLEVQNSELERFVYTVSHDLKSPLVTITGFLGYLEKDALAGKTERVQQDVVRIREAASKMTVLLDEILELSRIGRIVNEPEEVTSADLVAEALGNVEGAISAGGVDVEVAPDLPKVRGDRTRLVEVWQNLIENAVKYRGEQEDPRIEIGVLDGASPGVFFVRDNGIGIEDRHHRSVFELFRQLDPEAEGTGIGLAIVKRIIDYHNGRIWVESDGPGQGSTFCFTVAGPLT